MKLLNTSGRKKSTGSENCFTELLKDTCVKQGYSRVRETCFQNESTEIAEYFFPVLVQDSSFICWSREETHFSQGKSQKVQDKAEEQ